MGTRKSRSKLIADTAIIHPTAKIGSRTKIWAFTQVAEYAIVGNDCVIGNGAYIDRYVRIGDRVRIHNKALLYHGLIVKDDVFIGPGVCYANDSWPRSGSARDLTGKTWTIGNGASIGANATILPDVSIGAYALIGAGSVVTQLIPSHALAYGNPAKIQGFVCYCGKVFKRTADRKSPVKIICKDCKKSLSLSYLKP